MNNQKSAIKRLQSRVAKVSCHYIVSKKGKVYRMVNDKDVAWHAGKSKWKKDKNLNNCSITSDLSCTCSLEPSAHLICNNF